METFNVEILNPKAKKLLQNLADLNLISIKENPEKDFIRFVKQLRRKSKHAPSMEEITREVEIVRAKRQGK